VNNVKMDLRKICWCGWAGLIGLGLGPVAGFCEHGNEISGAVKYWEVLE
jgi:hypothetical protein